jgi:uncharacterized repeat protein (TIGR02543 family)
MKIKKGIKYLSCLTCLVFSLAGCQSGQGDKTYSVTFNYNYADSPKALVLKVKAGQTVEKPTAPVREGYTFAHWDENIAGTKEFDFSTKIDSNLRLFAFWGQSVATVTFVLGNGQADLTQSVKIGEAATRPADPVRDDYRFDDWYSEATFKTKYDFSQAIEEDTSIYANWIQTAATVSFLNYDGSLFASQKVKIGEKAVAPSQNPTREDYAFNGWYTDQAGKSAFDFAEAVTKDLSLYSGWKQTVATVTFDPNYDGGSVTTAKSAIGAALSAPSDPSRTGYTFGGWYTNPSCTSAYDFTKNVEGDFTLYAKWNINTYTVTFNLNYDGSTPVTAYVNYGGKVAEPADPTRTGYTFIGWFTDTGATVSYSFDSLITGDLTIYAGWVRNSGNTNCIITFYWNDGVQGVYKTTTTKIGNSIMQPTKPTRTGYYFAGWATDAAGANLFSFSSTRASEDMPLYAKWLKEYNFEAEYVYIDPSKPVQGSSDNGRGTDCVMSVKDVPGNGTQMGISNSYYIGKLYYNGAFLDFEITSSKAVTDAVLILRLTPDLYDMEFTDDTYQVLVNGTKLSYGSLSLTGAYASSYTDPVTGALMSGDSNKRPFQNYTISTTVSLKEGANTVRLLTNNSVNHGGTFEANTPLVDCMYIASSSTMTWTNSYPANCGQTAADVKYDVIYQ